MMLQFIKKHYANDTSTALYVSLDHLYFTKHSLLDFVDDFYKNGGKHLFLDEVHKYQGWSREIKNIYDGYPDMKIVFTGSSLLNILNAEADLSRRCVTYDIQGLSFREYLLFKHDLRFPIIKFDDILNNSQEIEHSVNALCRPLQYFPQYLIEGYYLFFLQDNIDYLTQVQKIANMILEIELPQQCNVDISNIRKIRSLLSVISSRLPFIIDISKTAKMSELSRNTILAYLSYLDRAKLINMLYRDNINLKRLQKPDKIYMENPNLLHALSLNEVDKGTERETFFINQIAYQHSIEYAQKADFTIDHRYTIEVGGQSKGYKQLAGTSEAYIASDGIEYSIGKKIPLWLFGFMY